MLVDYFGQLVFCNFGMARVASQRYFYEKQHLFVFFRACCYISIFSNQKRRALNICKDWSKNQLVNSDLKPFRVFLDDVGTQTTPA